MDDHRDGVRAAAAASVGSRRLVGSRDDPGGWHHAFDDAGEPLEDRRHQRDRTGSHRGVIDTDDQVLVVVPSECSVLERDTVFQVPQVPLGGQPVRHPGTTFSLEAI